MQQRLDCDKSTTSFCRRREKGAAGRRVLLLLLLLVMIGLDAHHRLAAAPPLRLATVIPGTLVSARAASPPHHSPAGFHANWIETLTDTVEQAIESIVENDPNGDELAIAIATVDEVSQEAGSHGYTAPITSEDLHADLTTEEIVELLELLRGWLLLIELDG